MAGSCNKDKSIHTRDNSVCAGTYSCAFEYPRCYSGSVVSGGAAGCNADGGTLDKSIISRDCICISIDVIFGINASGWANWGTAKRG